MTDKGLTRADLVRETGYARSVVYNLTTGKTPPPNPDRTDLYFLLSRLLNVSEIVLVSKANDAREDILMEKTCPHCGRS